MPDDKWQLWGTHHRRPDLRRIADPQLVSQLRQHALEPAGVAGGFDAYQNWTCQPTVKHLRLSRGMFQATLDQLARFRIQHRDLLVARV